MTPIFAHDIDAAKLIGIPDTAGSHGDHRPPDIEDGGEVWTRRAAKGAGKTSERERVMEEITVIFRIEVAEVPEPTGGVIDLQGPLLSANVKTPTWEREITIKEGFNFDYEISFYGPGVVYKDPRVRREGEG